MYLLCVTVSSSANNAIRNISATNMRQSVFQLRWFHQLSSIPWQRQNFHIQASIEFQFFSMYAVMFRVHRHSTVVLIINTKSINKQFKFIAFIICVTCAFPLRCNYKFTFYPYNRSVWYDLIHFVLNIAQHFPITAEIFHQIQANFHFGFIPNY